MVLHRFAVLLGTALALGACADDPLPASSVEAAASQPPPRLPAVHVAAVSSACASPRGSREPTGTVAGCKLDAECTAGLNGRCLVAGLGFAACSYDGCAVDADCGAGGFCDCRDEGGTGANSCVTGSDCRTDADCGGPYCSPSKKPDGCGGTSLSFQGYFCHSGRDACIDDADCARPNTAGGASCDYDSGEKKWRCSVRECVSD